MLLGGCLKPADTAGYFVRLRETSVVCMRLEEEEEAEDGTLLMLMRELSVSVANIGVPTVKRWSFLAIFFPFRLIVGSEEGSCNKCAA